MCVCLFKPEIHRIICLHIQFSYTSTNIYIYMYTLGRSMAGSHLTIGTYFHVLGIGGRGRSDTRMMLLVCHCLTFQMYL